jgi:hypothetical protein
MENNKYNKVHQVDIVKTYHFSTLYTIIHHEKWKSRLFNITDDFLKQKW